MGRHPRRRVIYVDLERGTITRVVTVAEALPSDLLYGSCSDGRGQLWLGTPSMLPIIVRYPGLKHLGLSLAGLRWPRGLLLRFQEPSAFDTTTSRQGPQGALKNGGDISAHPQVWHPIKQGVRALCPRRSGDFLPLSLLLQRQTQEGCASLERRRCHPRLGVIDPTHYVGTLSRVVPWPPARCISWCHGSRWPVKPDSTLKRLKLWRFLPPLKLVGFHA
jgi:hypothetical protein